MTKIIYYAEKFSLYAAYERNKRQKIFKNNEKKKIVIFIFFSVPINHKYTHMSFLGKYGRNTFGLRNRSSGLLKHRIHDRFGEN